MFARTFILIAVAITGINAACDNGTQGYTHDVVPGDTCYAIANQGGIDVPRLQSANPGISCNSLFVGQASCDNRPVSDSLLMPLPQRICVPSN
ncbi:hypothetical protein EDD18DRAFT_1127965 [Armillaria luteobubalina]|uniref:LysM domain-containing protein n=1 Tax=Armillaria luteobubalina TaxID=153913 RepID=A0AA39QLK2_9AGAR|nr:hypothetical protein EDD18DRAFT_1127965 [Armillaria luteobubalina]